MSVPGEKVDTSIRGAAERLKAMREPEAVEQPEVAEQPEPERADPEQPERTEQPEKVAKPETTELAEEQDAADQDVIEVSSINDLAEHLGVDVADIYQNLRIPISDPDGQRKEITLGEYKDLVQDSEKFTRERGRLDSERKQWEEARQAKERQVEQYLQQTMGMLTYLEQQAMQKARGTNWEQLRAEDPGQYAAERQQLIEMQNAIGQYKAHAVQVATQQRQQMEQESQQRKTERMKREWETMSKAVPKWQDPEFRRSETAKIVDFGKRQYGIDEHGLEALDGSSALLRMAMDAMAYQESRKAANAAKKKVLKFGKRPVSPGPRPGKSEVADDALNQARAKLRKSGSVRDAAASIGLLRRGK